MPKDEIRIGKDGNDIFDGGAGDDLIIEGAGEITLEDFTSTGLDATDFGFAM